MRDESGPATAEWREREEAGKKDKGRSDEGIYPILAGVAAGCRVQGGAGGSLIGSPRIDREEGGAEGREKIAGEHGVLTRPRWGETLRSAWPPPSLPPLSNKMRIYTSLLRSYRYFLE